ncbi:hypothetical protein Pmani_013369 [Petrolisthes manimaculis]|uniref:Cuticle protein n=1 Tax=Petrolisthes manimaculis TaxID=1843537 RepID=A0AAE1U9G0_9EUCA|nr:hypothetical protein Pmani_013369 [Petrolisthes manimaculis]
MSAHGYHSVLDSIEADVALKVGVDRYCTSSPPSAPPPEGLLAATVVVTVPVQPPSGLYQAPEASDHHTVKTVATPTTTTTATPTPTTTTTATPTTTMNKMMMNGMPYDFGWGVDDPDSGNQFSQKEKSDGNVVRGQYSVLLPDGRVQIVKYYDDGGGFVVQLSYE